MPMLTHFHLNVTKSTNDYAKLCAGKTKMPILVTADTQTEGRGRRGKSFYSPDKTGLYMSVMIDEPADFNLITPAAALAVCEVIEKRFAVQPQIKWVNDIYLEGKKICGILCERVTAENKNYIVIGIGINLTTEDFPADIPNGGSIGKDYDKQILSEMIFHKLLHYFTLKNKTILRRYKNKCFVIGKNITYIKDNEIKNGKAVDINDECNLIVELNGKRDTLSSGEISIKF